MLAASTPMPAAAAGTKPPIPRAMLLPGYEGPAGQSVWRSLLAWLAGPSGAQGQRKDLDHDIL